MARILVIEDDQRIRELVCQHLSENGHSVTSKTNGLEGLKAATEQKPELLVLDLGLPDLDGLDLIKMIRGVADLPVLVLTAREDEQTILSAFDGGADDFVVKPISGPQLSARVTALLRRAGKDKVEILRVGELEIHLGPRFVTLSGEMIELTAKEFDVLAYLAARPETVIPKEELYSAIWKAPGGTEGRTVDVHISTIRKKLGEKPENKNGYLQTLKGAGVKIQEPSI